MCYRLRYLLPLLVTLGGVPACDTSPTTTGGNDGGGPPCTQGTKLATLPACTAPVSAIVNVPLGCAPAVDGTYTQGEWGDAVCVTVGTDSVYLKYSGTYLYLAWPMSNTCTGSCPANLAFNTDGAIDLDGNQIDLVVYDDDPMDGSGDSGEVLSGMGAWNEAQAVESDISIANPAGTSDPVTYEFAIPFSRLGITPGQLDTVGLALSHYPNEAWPSGLTVDPSNSQPILPSNWGQLSSQAKWK